VANLASLPQPAVLVTGGVTGVDVVGVGVCVDVDVGVESLLAALPPPQATSVMRSNAVHTCLIFPSSIGYKLFLMYDNKTLENLPRSGGNRKHCVN
jgi:hypothetical protein